MAVGGNVLCPQVSLHADDVLLFFGSKMSGLGIEAVHALNGNITADGKRFALNILCLVVVEIEIRGGSHDGIMSLTGCLVGMVLAAPSHNGGIGCKTAFQDFIPTNNLASLLVEELLGMADEETLQVLLGSVLVVTLYAQLLDASLTLGALLPTGLGALVAADVDVF